MGCERARRRALRQLEGGVPDACAVGAALGACPRLPQPDDASPTWSATGWCRARRCRTSSPSWTSRRWCVRDASGPSTASISTGTPRRRCGREARAAMLQAMDVVGNPSSVHAEGRAARAIVERARARSRRWSAASRARWSSPPAPPRRRARRCARAGRSPSSTGMEHDAVHVAGRERDGAIADVLAVRAIGRLASPRRVWPTRLGSLRQARRRDARDAPRLLLAAPRLRRDRRSPALPSGSAMTSARTWRRRQARGRPLLRHDAVGRPVSGSASRPVRSPMPSPRAQARRTQGRGRALRPRAPRICGP